MRKILTNTIKATIIRLIVALFITFLFCFGLNLVYGAEIDETFSLVSKIVIDDNEKEDVEMVINEDNQLRNYPEYGTQYATIQIPKIDVDLPVYFGSTLEILKNGVGHDSNSYFPSEGGTIIYMGHNSKSVFRRFSELELDDEITVTASYGTFTYKIYDMQIVYETETYKLPIQKEKEILMIYTCYPFNNVAYTNRRYVVYAELEQ